jgi:hypothetical protein
VGKKGGGQLSLECHRKKKGEILWLIRKNCIFDRIIFRQQLIMLGHYPSK